MPKEYKLTSRCLEDFHRFFQDLESNCRDQVFVMRLLSVRLRTDLVEGPILSRIWGRREFLLETHPTLPHLFLALIL
jgi:hypothetical protein